MTIGKRIGTAALAVLAAVGLIHVLGALSATVSAYDATVGSDSATAAVATSADGRHVYICDGKRCYASHDAGETFSRLKVD